MGSTYSTTPGFEEALPPRHGANLASVKGPTDETLGGIHNAQDEAFNLIDQLEIRLQRVRQTYPETPPKDGVQKAAPTELLEALGNLRDRQNGVSARLRALLESIVL